MSDKIHIPPEFFEEALKLLRKINQRSRGRKRVD